MYETTKMRHFPFKVHYCRSRDRLKGCTRRTKKKTCPWFARGLHVRLVCPTESYASRKRLEYTAVQDTYICVVQNRKADPGWIPYSRMGAFYTESSITQRLTKLWFSNKCIGCFCDFQPLLGWKENKSSIETDDDHTNPKPTNRRKK